MKKLFKRRPSLSFVLALLALVIATSTGAHAVVTAQKNSVVSKSIKNGQVKTADLAKGAVSTKKVKADAINSAKVKDRSIQADDLAYESVGGNTLGAVITATGYSPVTVDADGTPNGGQHGNAEATAICPDGYRVIGGGATWFAPSSPGSHLENVYLQAQHQYANGWRARGIVDFGAQGNIRLQAIAYCLVETTPQN